MIVVIGAAALALSWASNARQNGRTQSQAIVACYRGNAIRDNQRFIILYLINKTNPSKDELQKLVEARGKIKNPDCADLFAIPVPDPRAP